MQGTALPELELSLKTELTFQDASLQILGKTRDEVIRGNQQPRVRFQDQNINRYAQNRYQNDFEYGQRVINNNRYLNRLDPTGRYTDTYPEYEQNANQGHEYQDEYQNQYQDQYQDQYNGYPLN